MADSKKEVLKLFERIGEVKKAGLRSRYGLNQSEVFRLYGMIEWILGLEEIDILEEPEGWESVGPSNIRNGLKTAKERLNLAPVTEGLVKEVNMASGELSDFPKYSELPGPLVREKILGHLNPHDQLSVVNAIPLEAEYLPQPLSFLQFEAVFPILNAKGLLEEEDVENLKGVDSYFKRFINKHLEGLDWKKENGLFAGLDFHIRECVPLKDFAEFQKMGGQYDGLVSVCPRQDNYPEVMEDLKSCGNSILECYLAVGDNLLQLEQVMVSCLQLMPNLERLTVHRALGSPDIGFDEVALAYMLPKLAALKTLRIMDWNQTVGVFTRSLFRKYGAQLEKLSIFPRMGPPQPLVMFFSKTLTVLKLNVIPNASQEGVIGYLNIFRECKLKNLEINFTSVPANTCINETLRRLLITVGTNWGQTLESLSIPLQLNGAYPSFLNHGINLDEPTWMANLVFAKLKSFELRGYPIGNSWEFLLLFPELQEFTYYPLGENADIDADNEEDDLELEANDEDKPFIKLYRKKQNDEEQHVENISEAELDPVQDIGLPVWCIPQ